MKFYRFLCSVLCLLLVSSMFTGVYAAESAPSVTSGCSSVDAALPIGGSQKLTDTATAAIVFERSTGTLVYAYNPDQRIYPSSMVKLMTVLVALEHGDLDATVTVTRSALESMGIGVVSVNLQRGEEMKLRDLLYCVMIASANDASTVVAEHIGGSQEGFVALMNEKAAQLGCEDTNFTNAHGLHDENCYTTARDILRVVEYGLNNEEFRTMFQTAIYTIPATNKTEERVIHTTNYMMSREVVKKHFDSRVTGGKTGSTDAAGRCLAVTAQVGDMELIGIVMGAKASYSEDGMSVERFGSFEEMAQLLDHVQEKFERRQLFYANQVITQYPVKDGRNHVVTGPAEDGFCILPKGITAHDLTWKYADSAQGLAAPISKGQSITEMEVWYGDICLAITDLTAMYAVDVFEPYEEPKSATDKKNEESHGDLLALILGVILGIVVTVILGMFLIRILRIAIVKARIRRRRRNRRRNRNARME